MKRRSFSMKLSLILMVYNTSHLMARTLQTLQKQTMDPDDWELIVIDDMSQDDALDCIRAHGQGVGNLRYIRLDHDMGMRGNTASINHGVSMAMGDAVMWSTPEVMLPPDALQAVYDTVNARQGNTFVTIPSHGLMAEMQMKIDDVDWQSDVDNIKELVADTDPEGWDSVWFWLNFYKDGRKTNGRQPGYGNNQTVGVRRQTWLDTIGEFPLFLDYGSDDPWLADERKKFGFQDITLWEQEAYHQWHCRAQYWMAKGNAPNWNYAGHTTSNVANDPEVPDGGTCEIWDGGDKRPLSEAEIADALREEEHVIASGYKARQQLPITA